MAEHGSGTERFYANPLVPSASYDLQVLNRQELSFLGTFHPSKEELTGFPGHDGKGYAWK